MLPSLFLSHGSPRLMLMDHAVNALWAELGRAYSNPKAVVVMSAHWMTDGVRITPAGPLETIHDFYGFPQELYEIIYPASGADWLQSAVLAALAEGGTVAEVDDGWGLDHGSWSVLRTIYPEAPCPMMQVSLTTAATPQDLAHLGRALSPLRADDVLIIGSGGITHNLGARSEEGAPPPDWAVAFDQWLDEKLTAGDEDAVLNARAEAPAYDVAHPTDEHFLPIHFALGAGLGDGNLLQAERLEGGYNAGSLSVSGYRFL